MMKKNLIIILLFFIWPVYCQKQDNYDVLIDKLEISEKANTTVNSLIDYFYSLKPNVPKHVWDEIRVSALSKKDIYISGFKKILKENYSEKEVLNILSKIDTDGFSSFAIKEDASQSIYELGRSYGRQIGILINEKLKSLGY